MDLAPQRYLCENHDEDLTELVRDELDDRIPVAFARGMRPFRVVVACPGGGAAHEVTFAGEVRY